MWFFSFHDGPRERHNCDLTIGKPVSEHRLDTVILSRTFPERGKYGVLYDSMHREAGKAVVDLDHR